MPARTHAPRNRVYKCDEPRCQMPQLALEICDLSEQQLDDIARERGWMVLDDNNVFCPEHAQNQSLIDPRSLRRHV